MRLAFASYLDAIVEESARVADSRAPLGAAVPGTDWRVADVLEHLAEVFETWSAAIAGDPAESAGAIEDRAGIEVAAEHVVSALGTAGPSATVAGPDGEVTTGFLARRLALECAVHRVDVEAAGGRDRPVETELAIDGITECLERLGGGSPLEVESLGGSLALVCSDDPTAFLIEVHRGRLAFRARRGPADAVVVAPASELFLYCWGRRAPDALDLTGVGPVAAAFAGLSGESR